MLSDSGMRHRSAYRFCQAVPGAIAFVVSHDAAIAVFCGRQRGRQAGGPVGEVEMFEGLTPERWLM